MKSLYNVYEVSILGDIDDQINAYDNSRPDRIEKWIKENYECAELKISKKPNKAGLYEVSAYKAEVKNKNITSLTNGMFEWKKINASFSCSRCSNLKSLEGAPQKVGGWFDCVLCTSLESLVGAPEKVGGSFDCSECKKLSSLEGAPQKVGECFYCIKCSSLTSLAGAPEKVEGSFNCYNCKTQFIEDDVRKVSNVKGKIYC